MKRLSGYDAFLLYSETPNVHMHTLKVAILTSGRDAGVLTFDRFRGTIRARLDRLPPMRYQLIEVPLKLHHPVWLENVEIDIDDHVRRVQLPEPAGRHEFERLVGEFASTPLDRSRPMWELLFVEGLADRRVGVVAKVHHALADGSAAANMLSAVVDSPLAVSDHRPAERHPTATQLLSAAARDHLGQLTGTPRLVRETIGGIARLRKHARGRSVGRDHARNFSPPPTFMNHVLSPTRTYASGTLSLPDFKQTSKHLGITLNDLLLATSAGALREVMLSRDGTADEPIIVGIPVNNDPSPTRMSGNELGTLLASLPVHLDDRLERIRVTTEATRVAKEKSRLLGPDVMGRWMAYLPPGVAPALFRRLAQRSARNRVCNMAVSNVRGPQQRGLFAGATVSEFYGAGPVAAGAGVNITAWSYVDQLNISVIADDLSLPDPRELIDAMRREFVGIRSDTGLPAELSDVTTAMA